jgi:hypothetical protein
VRSHQLARTGAVEYGSIKGNLYSQATTGEDTADCKDLVCSVVIYKVYNSMRLLELRVVTIWKCSINPVINPNPMCSH